MSNGDEEAEGRFLLLFGLHMALTDWPHLKEHKDFRFALHEAGWTLYEWGDLILNPRGERALRSYRRGLRARLRRRGRPE
ncbi:MAG TPA: hypothetical protein PKW35_00690 [Nannocystaceae bacterium]|nr:hypothetical protein [Nannocystaceae bacterium]